MGVKNFDYERFYEHMLSYFSLIPKTKICKNINVYLN